MQNPNEAQQSAGGGMEEEQPQMNEPSVAVSEPKKSPWKVVVPIVLVVVVIAVIIWLVM